jgi:TPM domain
MNLLRNFKHLLTPEWLARRAFTPAVLKRVEAAIGQSEVQHRGEIRFALEGALPLVPLLKGATAHTRALQVFSDLRVWDTEENTGVLLYLQLVDRDIEIVADRGINACVKQDEWEAICLRMEAVFREGRYEAGVIHGINDITALLARHFPARNDNPDELSNKPVML